jgi:hypothetical protein
MAVLPVSIAPVALFVWVIGPLSFHLVSCRDYRLTKNWIGKSFVYAIRAAVNKCFPRTAGDGLPDRRRSWPTPPVPRLWRKDNLAPSHLRTPRRGRRQCLALQVQSAKQLRVCSHDDSGQAHRDRPHSWGDRIPNGRKHPPRLG